MSNPVSISALPAATPRMVALSFENRSRDGARADRASAPVAPAPTTTPVERAIASASRQTDIDFDFLLAQAKVESSLDPEAQARSSSATGLYQFIESTWLDTMKRHGDRFGLGEVADQISVNRNGANQVADPAARQAILALRNDPEIASLMAASLAEDNRAHLTPILGREPNHGELYLAHFLGAGGAGRFLSEMQSNPGQSAAGLFNQAARSNPAIFYERSGAPRSLSQVMDLLAAKIERAGGQQASGVNSLPPPYIIADEAVFAPLSPATVTSRQPPPNEPQSSLTLPATAASGASGSSASAPSMSSAFRATFEASGAAQFGSAESSGQIKRAYGQLKALGL